MSARNGVELLTQAVAKTMQAPPPSDQAWSWATVVTVDPITIRRDGDTTATSPAGALTPTTALKVGQRVWVQHDGRRRIIIGPAHGGGLATQDDVAAVTGGDWHELTLTDTTNFEPYAASTTPVYREIAGGVALSGALRLLTDGYIDSSGRRYFAELPPELYPSGYAPPFVCQGSSSNRWALRADSTGISAARYGPASSNAGAWLPFSVWWPLG